MLNRFDWKYIGLIILLLIVCFLVYFFQSEVLTSIKSFFEIKDLSFIAGIIATTFSITHKLKTKKVKFSPTMSFNQFRVPVEDILSFFGNPITLVCSISLAKGYFMQQYGSISYFPLFKDIEIAFIGLVTAYLLFISITELYINIKETILNGSTSNKNITAIPETEITDSVPKPEHLSQNNT